ncbi:MAG: GDP-L-fucose synthase [Candidatus Pacearchaeota archaeon]
MEKTSKIYIAGHKGLVGSAIKKLLEKEGYNNIICKTSEELDLRNQKKTEEFFRKEKPEYVFLAAAKVGGIKANIEKKAEFIYDNLMIETNVIHYSWKYKVKKLLFFGSNCMYPKECPQPIREEYFLTGLLEPTNDAYAVAKIAGVKLCQSYNSQYGTNFICAVPCSIFGENDNFDLNDSHFVPALIKKFHEAKIKKIDKVLLWGSGKPRREIMYSEDIASASLFLMKNYNSSEIINVGVNIDLEVREIAEIIKEIVNYSGNIIFDSSKPDGMMKKLLDSSKINSIGWKPNINLKEGLKKTYNWYLENIKY